MSILRSTDVKKHLGRAVPRFVSTETEKHDQAKDDVTKSSKRADTTTAKVATEAVQKAETN